MQALPTRFPTRSVAAAFTLVLMAGCGGGGEADETPSPSEQQESPTDGQDETEAGPDDDAQTGDGEDGTLSLDGATFTGTGTATVTFADGTVLSTDITCNAGQRELAGRELLYTVTSTGEVQFDLTVYGEGGTVQAVVLNLTDGEGTRTSAGGPLAAGPFELTELGTTVTASGTFRPGHAGDTNAEGETREADVDVSCG